MFATQLYEQELSWKGPVLVVPGLYGSESRHWQSRWERRFPHFERVEQDDWSLPDVDRWARRIVESALQLDGPALIIAHSFGCLAAVRAEKLQSNLIAGALLVAPADPARFGLEKKLQQVPLLFPSALIASSNDALLTLPRAQQLAERWGSQFISIGAKGHINAESGLGDWHEGIEQLELLCRRMTTPEIRTPVPAIPFPATRLSLMFSI
jgi:predicted alpha/beta hydrolase family esterase